MTSIPSTIAWLSEAAARPQAPLLSVAAASVAGVAGLCCWPRVRGTTLTAPWLWCLVAVGCVAAAEGYAYAAGDAARRATDFGVVFFRYVAAMGAMCPIVAVLGAKRPQNVGWQWTVAALWLVLVLPGGQAAAIDSGASIELSGPWALFVPGLCLLTLLSYGPTRHWFAGVSAAGGQLVLASPFLGFGSRGWAALAPLVGIALVAMGALSLHCVVARSGVPLEGLAAANDRWRRFVASWGAFWGLRLAARLNHTAELQAWSVRAGLGGLRAEGEAQNGLPTELPASTAEECRQIEAALDALLRRFERLKPRQEARD